MCCPIHLIPINRLWATGVPQRAVRLSQTPAPDNSGPRPDYNRNPEGHNIPDSTCKYCPAIRGIAPWGRWKDDGSPTGSVCKRCAQQRRVDAKQK